MFKRVLAFISVSAVFALTLFCYCLPVFYGYCDKFTVYFDVAASSGHSEEKNADEFPLFNKYGESCVIDKGKISVGEILYRFDAEIVFTEKIAEGVSYYAYSDKIPYRKTINGKTINLHIFVGREKTTVGSPIIFGSF